MKKLTTQCRPERRGGQEKEHVSRDGLDKERDSYSSGEAGRPIVERAARDIIKRGPPTPCRKNKKKGRLNRKAKRCLMTTGLKQPTEKLLTRNQEWKWKETAEESSHTPRRKYGRRKSSAGVNST